MSAKPRGFIGSSREDLKVARKLLQCLADSASIQIWDQGMVKPGQYVLESLADELEQSQFGIFVFTPNDVLRLREEEFLAVRDNVLFELGMFVGRLGRRRSFIVMPAGVEKFRTPADLLGVTVLEFDPKEKNLGIALAKACETIREEIEQIKVPAEEPAAPPKPSKRPNKPPTDFRVD